MRNLFIIISALIALQSCMVRRIELTVEEKELEESLQKNFSCPDFEIRHDYYAVTENRKDGSLAILLCDEFCRIDSTALKEMVLKTTKQIIPRLSHKSNYKSINFYTSVEKRIAERTSTLTCNKVLTVLLRQPNKVYLSKS